MGTKGCVVDDCASVVYVRQLCSMHYRRYQRGVLKLPNAAEEAAARLAGSLDWQEHAACRGLNGELWFPVSEKNDNPQVIRARAICAGCPVVLRCAEWALNTGMTDGIFGGTTSLERRRIRNAAKEATLQQQEAGVR